MFNPDAVSLFGYEEAAIPSSPQPEEIYTAKQEVEQLPLAEIVFAIGQDIAALREQKVAIEESV